MDPLTPTTLLRQPRRWTNEDEDRAEAEAIKAEDAYYRMLDARDAEYELRHPEFDVEVRGRLFPEVDDPEAFCSPRSAA